MLRQRIRGEKKKKEEKTAKMWLDYGFSFCLWNLVGGYIG
jgi:hypothetical protein